MKWYTALLLVLIGFASGWMTNGWRVGEQKAKVEANNSKADAKSAGDALTHVNTRLLTIVKQADEAAAQTTQTLAKLKALDEATNRQYNAVTNKTEQVNNEITKLITPKCVFDPVYGRMWQDIGKNANASRFTLYGTDSNNPH